MIDETTATRMIRNHQWTIGSFPVITKCTATQNDYLEVYSLVNLEVYSLCYDLEKGATTDNGQEDARYQSRMAIPLQSNPKCHELEPK
jgi:hypothetical protein